MSDIPQEIMDKIDEFVKNKVHVYYSSDAKDIAIFGYHLRDEEVERWKQMCDSTNQTNQALVKRLQELEKENETNFFESEVAQEQLQQKDQRIKELEEFLRELLSINSGWEEDGKQSFTSTGLKIKQLLTKNRTYK